MALLPGLVPSHINISPWLKMLINLATAGLSSLGVPGVPWHTQILADQLTLFQPRGTDYAHLITTDTPGFSDLPTALLTEDGTKLKMLFKI